MDNPFHENKVDKLKTLKYLFVFAKFQFSSQFYSFKFISGEICSKTNTRPNSNTEFKKWAKAAKLPFQFQPNLTKLRHTFIKNG